MVSGKYSLLVAIVISAIINNDGCYGAKEEVIEKDSKSVKGSENEKDLNNNEEKAEEEEEAAEEEEEDDHSGDVELVPTYRSGIERAFQELTNVISGGSSSSRSSEGGGSAIGGFINSIIPKPIKNVLEPVEKSAGKRFGDILNLFEDKFHAIFPGTLWCGGGNIAKEEEDVGLFKHTDACCRAHDNCPDNIEAGSSRDSLLNNGAFTRSACFCDREFYNCLKNVSTPISANIGATYFNILRPQCYAMEYPVESCAQYGRHRLIHRSRCLKYNLDTTRNKTLTWLDNPDF